MSLVTNFNFREFECDAARSRDGIVKSGVSLSVLTSEDMKRLAVVQIQVPCGRENPSAPWLRQSTKAGEEASATFWDTRMGNFDLRPFPAVACTTCSNNTEAAGRGPSINHRCSGHYGYISMPVIGEEGGTMVVYNPLLFRDMYALLRSQCFVCHDFRVAPIDVMRWYLALELFDQGLPAEALTFLQKYKGARDTAAPQQAVASEAASAADGRERKSKKSRADAGTTVEGQPSAAAVVNYEGIAGMRTYVAHTIRAAIASGRLPSEKSREVVLHAVVDLRNQLVSECLAELTSANKKCVHCAAESPGFTEKDGQLYLKLSKKAMDKLVAGNHMTAETREEYMTEMRVFSRERVLFPAHQALSHIMTLCTKQTDLLSKILRDVGSATVNVEFKNALPPHELYKALFLDCILVPPLNIRLASGVKVQDGGALAPDERTKTLSHVLTFVKEIEGYYRLNERTQRQQLANESNIRSLQQHVDASYELVLGSFAKKEGLFRMHMMGKRVNQACRSVISPDFTVEPNEVLLPRSFARNLSFPEQVSFHDPARTALLRKCVINGSVTYPGATHIEYHEAGSIRTVQLSDDPLDQAGRIARADAAFAVAKQGKKVVIYRHVLDGDRVIFNRQPTLHRPSMQSYEVKVLSSLKTLRFHYVSGKSYNADFDGDEMNVHVPQSLETRAELATIMDSNLCYLVPTSGKPIRGLIQDHCAAGVFLTLRDRFFDHDTFVQLVYSGLQPYLGARASKDLSAFIPQPTVLKPRALWTGKQVFSVLLKFITCVDGTEQGNQGITLRGSSAVYTTNWTTRDGSTVAGHHMGDEPLYVVGSELLVGVLDKNQLGPSSMSIAHAIHEVYGPHHVGRLFGALGRVLTYSLRYVGYSIGIEDMVLLDAAGRRKAMREIDLCALGITDEAQALTAISKAASALNSAFIPKKLRLHFPVNDLITMTASGAKGSNTNAIQMALTLGQQTFSGQRIGEMSSGKTAPSFFKGDTRARSKGFAMGRFVTGIRPAEYTIHAMAGRDGLIDTAVKTARSGYLQRCLVKGLESLTTHWDGTVRDANGAVIQFKFGGDGLDPCKSGTLNEYQMVYMNREDLSRRYRVGRFSPEVTDAPKEADCFDSSSDNDAPKELSAEEWRLRAAKEELEAPLPPHIASKLKRAKFQLDLKPRTIQRWAARGSLDEKLEEEQCKAASIVEEITKMRLARAVSEPGEPVGIVAAQAAGEPSTQMTLNTFHQAGQTVTHVTEGIPRLRELLMFASVAQPAVIVPVKDTSNGELEAVQTIIGRLTPKRLKDALAPLAKPYRWGMRRAEDRATLSIVMLFSVHALLRMRSSSGAAPRDHVVSFAAALRAFAKRVCLKLRGVVRSAAGTTRAIVTDPAELLNGDEEGEAVVRKRTDNDADDDDEREVIAEDPDDESAAGDAPQQGRSRSQSPTADGEGSQADDDENDDDNKLLVESLMMNAEAKRGALGCEYTRFPSMEDYFLSGSMHSIINACSPGEFMPDGALPVQVLQDLCAVKFTISMPANVVAVIPDTLVACMEQITLPTATPQVEECKWIPDTGKASGQLILQGAGAKLKTALKVVAPFAARYPGIHLKGIVSTDVRDIAETLGIEAAYEFLSRELEKLFKRHQVDARHCSLIADVATFRGTWHAFNFNGMIAHSASPLFQMTFASSRKFLERALSRGNADDLKSLSAAIMVGEMPKVGTGTVGISIDPAVVAETIVERNTRGSGLKPMRTSATLPPLA